LADDRRRKKKSRKYIAPSRWAQRSPPCRPRSSCSGTTCPRMYWRAWCTGYGWRERTRERCCSFISGCAAGDQPLLQRKAGAAIFFTFIGSSSFAKGCKVRVGTFFSTRICGGAFWMKMREVHVFFSTSISKMPVTSQKAGTRKKPATQKPATQKVRDCEEGCDC
jgi:hypothetical protein